MPLLERYPDLCSRQHLKTGVLFNGNRHRERERFRRRKQELDRAIDETRIKRLEEELEDLQKASIQEVLFARLEEERRQKMADLEAELALRKAHYQRMQRRLEEEKRRMFEDLLPKRFALRGEARVYPIAVEIRLPGGDA